MVYFSTHKTSRTGAQNTHPALTTQPNMEAIMADQKVLKFTEEEKEVWKPIPGYKGYYEASNKGRVRSVDRIVSSPVIKGGKKKHKGRILKQYTEGNGYKRCSYCVEGERGHISVHRAVLEAFKPNPENKPQCNHIDGDKGNNHVDNLEWVTHSENHSHAHKNGLHNPPKGSEHHNSKLTKEKVREIKIRLRDTDDSYDDIGEDYNVSASAIYQIKCGNNWKHVKI